MSDIKDKSKRQDSLETVDGESEVTTDNSSPDNCIKIVLIIVGAMVGTWLLAISIYGLTVRHSRRTLNSHAYPKYNIRHDDYQVDGYHGDDGNLNSLNEPVIGHDTEDFQIVQDQDMSSNINKRTDNHPLITDQPQQTMKLEDAEFKLVNGTCRTRNYVRRNIGNSGYSCRLVTKTASIPSILSENDGTCVTMYYWLYEHETNKDIFIHRVGPFYGHHVLNIHEQMFDIGSDNGSYRLYGCIKPYSNYENLHDINMGEYNKIERNIYITKESSHFTDLNEFYYNNKWQLENIINMKSLKIDEILPQNDDNITDYKSSVIESSMCIYSL